MKLHVLAIQGYLDNHFEFHADFYMAEETQDAVDLATAAFLRQHPGSRNIATSSYSLEDGLTLEAPDGKLYTLRIKEKK